MADAKEILGRGLPKWPVHLVSGPKLTHAQTYVTMFRTTPWDYVFSNDKAWQAAVVESVGLPQMPDWDHEKKEPTAEARQKMWADYNDAQEAFRNGHGLVELEYLGNHRVCSAHIAGPYGWLDWSGNVFTNNMGIGKWPEVESVFEEWKRIAAACPWLSLRSQLLDVEAGDPTDGFPVVEYKVDRGEVELVDPTGPIHRKTDLDITNSMHMLLMPGRERGCTLKQLEEAQSLTAAYTPTRLHEGKRMSNIVHVSARRTLTAAYCTETLAKINETRFGGFFDIVKMDDEPRWEFRIDGDVLWEMSILTKRKIGGPCPSGIPDCFVWAWHVLLATLANGWTGRIRDEAIGATWTPDATDPELNDFALWLESKYTGTDFVDHITEEKALVPAAFRSSCFKDQSDDQTTSHSDDLPSDRQTISPARSSDGLDVAGSSS